MPAYMICETCLGLWVRYGAETAKMRAITRDQSRMLQATEARKAVAQSIRIHEAIAHPLSYTATIAGNADRAKANAA